MRLAFDGAGHVHGKIVFNISGEVCNVVVTGGTYSINSVGIGTIASHGLAQPETRTATLTARRFLVGKQLPSTCRSCSRGTTQFLIFRQTMTF